MQEESKGKKESLPKEVTQWTSPLFEKYRGISTAQTYPQVLITKDSDYFEHAKGVNLNVNCQRSQIWWKKICEKQTDGNTIEEVISPNTIVKKSDWLHPVSDTAIYLLEKPYYIEFPAGNNVKYPLGLVKPNIKASFGGRKLTWVLKQCRIFKFAHETRNFKCTKLLVDLFESNVPEPLCCESIMSLLQLRRISIPFEYHCSTCPHLLLKSQPARGKKPGS